MRRGKPKFMLRNYLARQAIEQASGPQDYRLIEQLLVVLSAPFDEQPQWAQRRNRHRTGANDWRSAIPPDSCSG